MSRGDLRGFGKRDGVVIVSSPRYCADGNCRNGGDDHQARHARMLKPQISRSSIAATATPVPGPSTDLSPMSRFVISPLLSRTVCEDHAEIQTSRVDLARGLCRASELPRHHRREVRDCRARTEDVRHRHCYADEGKEHHDRRHEQKTRADMPERSDAEENKCEESPDEPCTLANAGWPGPAV